MSDLHARRGFLRGLVSLPLIGGGVTLIGRPTAAAEPITRQLLDAYDEWLDNERRFLKWERFGSGGIEPSYWPGCEVVWRNRATGETFDFRPASRVRSGQGQPGDSPASRAAVVLSAVGCGWRAPT